MALTSNQNEFYKQSIALIGYGVTGKACAEFLLEQGANVSVYDKSFKAKNSAKETVNLGIEKAITHEADISDNKLQFHQLNDNSDLLAYDLVVVSPGVNLQQAFIKRFEQHHQSQQAKVISDIEVFARALQMKNSNSMPTKVVAITGSNGKSTVVDMLTKCLNQAGVKVGLGGNFGISALTLLKNDNDVIVLELSSFQLESTYTLAPDIACILNISSDHLDRHGSLQAYIDAKHVIYKNAKHIIYNRDDNATHPVSLKNATSFGYLADAKAENNVDFYQTKQGIYQQGRLIMDLTSLPDVNQHQLLNMQVVLACLQILTVDVSPAIRCLTNYHGLSHRFEVVTSGTNETWINDSKATNPGASVAAIESVSKQSDYIVLIAGGDAKNADLSTLRKCISTHVDYLLLLGKDAQLFTEFDKPYCIVSSLNEAVNVAAELVSQFTRQHANQKATVLLSPACASIDMFKNYQQRGELFTQAVLDLVAA